jgi:hypothetical protein
MYTLSKLIGHLLTSALHFSGEAYKLYAKTYKAGPGEAAKLVVMIMIGVNAMGTFYSMV